MEQQNVPFQSTKCLAGVYPLGKTKKQQQTMCSSLKKRNWLLRWTMHFPTENVSSMEGEIFPVLSFTNSPLRKGCRRQPPLPISTNITWNTNTHARYIKHWKDLTLQVKNIKIKNIQTKNDHRSNNDNPGNRK